MKTAIRLFLFCCLAAAPLLAQVPTDTPVDVLRTPGWNKGIYGGFSTSVDSTPSGQSVIGAFRLGRVLTHELGSGPLRGSFEMAVDIIPVDVFWSHGGVYGGGINPVVAKWNFTKGCKYSPYLSLDAGVLFTTHNFPPGDTAQINFITGPELGLQMFHKGQNSLNLTLKAFHLSNASIGNHNPGINASMQFLVGYTWH